MLPYRSLTPIQLPTTLAHIYGILCEVLSTALDSDVFAICSTKPSASFLTKCTILDQRGDDTEAKVVAVVDRTANIAHAASAVGSSRTLFGGKSSYGPDVVFVNEFVADDFIYHLVQAITPSVLRETAELTKSLSKTRHDNHSSFIKELESNEGCKIVLSGASGSIVEIKDR